MADKLTGKASLSLFKVQSKYDLELNKMQAERLYERLGLEKPKDKTVQKFSIPLVPTKEDFYLFPFRHISACVVGAHSYKATDFSEGNVLKKSTPLLEGKPAYKNHMQAVGNEIGTIGETEWTAPYKNKEGDQVPGGIEAPFVIDSILYPELVRQLSSPISPIDSCSVTTVFEWEASHEFEHDGDFFWNLGTIIKDSKGREEMVRRIVTNILSYEESSLVWMGADPYAKMLNDKGQVENIDKAFAYSRNKFSQDHELSKYDSGRRYFVFDCLDSEKLLHLSKSTIDFSKAKTENTDTMDKDLLELLASLFNTTSDKIQKGEFKKSDAEKVMSVKTASEFSTLKTNAENFEKATTEKVALEGKVNTLTSEVSTLKAAKEKAEGDLSALKPKIEGYEAIVKSAKTEAKRVYGLFAKGKPEKAIEDELESETSMEKLEAKIKMWGGASVTEFGATCGDCKSTNIQFRKSDATNDDDASKKGAPGLNMHTLAHI